MPSEQEYNFYGGFAVKGNTYKSKQAENPYSGPNWFVDGVKDIY
jgi:hypothetical protein